MQTSLWFSCTLLTLLSWLEGDDYLKRTVYHFSWLWQTLVILTRPLDIRWPCFPYCDCVFALNSLSIRYPLWVSRKKQCLEKTVNGVKIITKHCSTCHFDVMSTTGYYKSLVYVLYFQKQHCILDLRWLPCDDSSAHSQPIWYLLHNLAALMTLGSDVVPTALDYLRVLSQIQDILTLPSSIGRFSRYLN